MGQHGGGLGRSRDLFTPVRGGGGGVTVSDTQPWVTQTYVPPWNTSITITVLECKCFFHLMDWVLQGVRLLERLGGYTEGRGSCMRAGGGLGRWGAGES